MAVKSVVIGLKPWSPSEKIRQHFLQNGREATFLREITRQFKLLGDLGIPNYLDLVQRVDSRAKCDAFLQSTGFNFDGLIEMLNYLFRWVLPFKCPIRELVDTDDERGRTYLETFMKVYYRTIGKDFSDFKAAIPLDWMIRGARVLPRIIEE